MYRAGVKQVAKRQMEQDGNRSDTGDKRIFALSFEKLAGPLPEIEADEAQLKPIPPAKIKDNLPCANSCKKVIAASLQKRPDLIVRRGVGPCCDEAHIPWSPEMFP